MENLNNFVHNKNIDEGLFSRKSSEEKMNDKKIKKENEAEKSAIIELYDKNKKCIDEIIDFDNSDTKDIKINVNDDPIYKNFEKIYDNYKIDYDNIEQFKKTIYITLIVNIVNKIFKNKVKNNIIANFIRKMLFTFNDYKGESIYKFFNINEYINKLRCFSDLYDYDINKIKQDDIERLRSFYFLTGLNEAENNIASSIIKNNN